MFEEEERDEGALEWQGMKRHNGYVCINVLCFCYFGLISLAKATLFYVGPWAKGVRTLELLVTLYSK